MLYCNNATWCKSVVYNVVVLTLNTLNHHITITLSRIDNENNGHFNLHGAGKKGKVKAVLSKGKDKQ